MLLDNATLDLREMWTAPYAAVTERLAKPGSKVRERGSLSVPEFKRLAVKMANQLRSAFSACIAL